MLHSYLGTTKFVIIVHFTIRRSTAGPAVAQNESTNNSGDRVICTCTYVVIIECVLLLLHLNLLPSFVGLPYFHFKISLLHSFLPSCLPPFLHHSYLGNAKYV